MLFQLTLNMPSHEGRLVHQITCEHPAESLKAFLDVISTSDFIHVDEFYKDGNKKGDHDYDPKKKTALKPNGSIVINTALIGKAKAYVA